eukprot:TRINITY_DN40192_c0_g1_i1.p1 TRINITY_DN40192_c0_g1~~TRINITY_DN40192_c0_g1_i1.p1  ORF type:complete len:577 (+),score=119.25 TRINITY_DN40192_c0_g1_i1:216-1733(+)
MAQKLRQNLTDETLRSAVRQRCSSVPLNNSARSRGASLANSSVRERSGKRSAGGLHSTNGAPLSRSRASSSSTTTIPNGNRMPRSASSGALSAASSAASTSAAVGRRRAGGGTVGAASVPSVPSVRLQAEPIPIRGKKGLGLDSVQSSLPDRIQVPAEAAAALAQAVASLRGGGCSASMAVASAVAAAAADAGGSLCQELQTVSAQLAALEMEERPMSSSSSSTSLKVPTRSGVKAPAPSPVASDKADDSWHVDGESESRRRRDSGHSEAAHPWLLADGRLTTARLEGENLALKKAVQKARSEIDVLLKGRSQAEERVRALNAENNAAAEVLRLHAGSQPSKDGQALLQTPSSRLQGIGSAEVAAGCGSSDAAAAMSLRRLMMFESPASTTKLSVEQSSYPAPATPVRSIVSGGLSGEFVAGGLPALPGGGDSGGGLGTNYSPSQVSQVSSACDEQARSKLLQTSDDICRRMEELLSRRGKKLEVVLDAHGVTIHENGGNNGQDR